MKYGGLIHLANDLPWFDLALLAQLSGEKKRNLTIQLHQWVRKGKLVPLRRGLYTLPNHYRKASLSPVALANGMHYPSYLTSLWALGFYGVIPEKVVEYTSVTTRVPRVFENAFGRFSYSHLKRDYFWGFQEQKINNASVQMAHPEKALLDFWHLNEGEWSEARLSEMRFQNLEMVDLKALESAAKRWGSPRLLRAVSRWRQLAHENRKGVIEL